VFRDQGRHLAGDREALRVILRRVRRSDREGAQRGAWKRTTTTCAGRQYFHQWRRKSVEYAGRCSIARSKSIPITRLAHGRGRRFVLDTVHLIGTPRINLRQAISRVGERWSWRRSGRGHVARGIAVSLTKKSTKRKRSSRQHAARSQAYDAGIFTSRLSRRGGMKRPAKMSSGRPSYDQGFPGAEFSGGSADGWVYSEAEVATQRALKL